MSKLKVPTAASKWNHNILSSIGIGFTRINSFEKFFGIAPPTTFGIGLEPHLQDYVNENIQRICDIGLLDEKRFDAARGARPFQHNVLNFLQAENNVMTRYPREESAVDRFAKTTLDLLGFNLVSGIDVHGPAKMSVQVGGETVSANPDIVVSNTSTNVILIVQEDKSLLSETPKEDAIAQLMAEVLAAFTYNNIEGDYKQQTIYGILLRGTIPLFFKTPVNNESVAKIKKTRKEIDDMLIKASYYCPHNSMNEVGYLRTKQEYLLEFLQCFEAMRQMAI